MKKIKKTILLSGGFDPLHSGHIDLIKDSRNYCDHITIGLNSDEWLKRKKGTYFMPFDERKQILLSLEAVDAVINFDDSDNTANDAIYKSLDFSEKVIFANGGDRDKTNIPEYKEFKSNNKIEFKYEVGGSNKKNSSSLVLKTYLKKISNNKYPNTKYTKPWGFYEILLEGSGFKIKKITVKPNQRLSLQFHEMRSEHWIIVNGKAAVTVNKNETKNYANDHIYIPINSQHRIKNIGTDDLEFIEISLGNYLEEDDIVRIEDDYNRSEDL